MQLLASFDIDDDELDGVTSELAFVLGVEWQQFWADVQKGVEFERPVHKVNVERLSALAADHGFIVTVEHVDETWSTLYALPRPRLVLVQPC